MLELSVPVEGEETYGALERIRNTVARFYDYEDIYLVGNSTSDKDLSTSFSLDNTIITVLTALFVMIILLFTFQSAGLPVLLVLTIQGSIWMNFSCPICRVNRCISWDIWWFPLFRWGLPSITPLSSPAVTWN